MVNEAEDVEEVEGEVEEREAEVAEVMAEETERGGSQ